MEETVNLAISDRPGPVHIDISYDVLAGETTDYRNIKLDVKKPEPLDHIPFATMMDAKGAIVETHELSLGMIGVSGDIGVKEYFFRSDAVLAIGKIVKLIIPQSTITVPYHR